MEDHIQVPMTNEQIMQAKSDGVVMEVLRINGGVCWDQFILRDSDGYWLAHYRGHWPQILANGEWPPVYRLEHIETIRGDQEHGGELSLAQETALMRKVIDIFEAEVVALY